MALSFIRRLSTSAPEALRICVVGAGPAGFYTADRLLKKLGDARVDIVDRLPSPFGLVRSGVAPDHQDTKNVINQFTALGKDPRVNFLGNVTLGKDVSLAELRQLYHGVVLSYGAESDRRLGIPGETAKGVISAREFVWWYNGHPDMPKLPVDLARVESVAVCGIGNVALDCARVLLHDPKALCTTDAAAHALSALAAPKPGSKAAPLRSVHLVARRGPVQAACTPKELKELVTELPGVAVHAAADQMAVSESDAAEMAATRMKRRVHDIIKQAADKTGSRSAAGKAEDKHLHFQFYRQPREVLTDDQGNVKGLIVEKTALKSEKGKPAVAVGTGELETIPAQLVLVSIGYRSLPVQGAPFNPATGTIPNAAGRVLLGSDSAASSSGQTDPGLYVCGWLKRGPTGIIGTNALDADETAGSIAVDAATGLLNSGSRREATEGLRALLHSREVQVVDFPGWLRIDAAEVARGQSMGKVREKITDKQEMVHVASAT